MSSGYPHRSATGAQIHQSVAPCRDCREPIKWATTPRGARIPLDLEPVPAMVLGTAGVRPYLLIERPGDWRLAVELHDPDLAGEALAQDGLDLATSHFDTCPRRPQPRERADLA